MRKYNIRSENTEPHHPEQNPAYQAGFVVMTQIHCIGHYATQKRMVDGLKKKFEATGESKDHVRLQEMELRPATLYLQEHSQVDRDISTAFLDQEFVSHFVQCIGRHGEMRLGNSIPPGTG